MTETDQRMTKLLRGWQNQDVTLYNCKTKRIYQLISNLELVNKAEGKKGWIKMKAQDNLIKKYNWLS